MARETYNWGEEFQRKLLALYLREPQKAMGIVEPAYFTDPISQDIARLAKEVLKDRDRKEIRLARSTMYTIVKGFLGKKRQELWRPYRKTIRAAYKEDLSDQPIVLNQALTFAKEQKFRQALVESEKDINNHRFGKAIQRFNTLKGFGSEKDLGVEYWKDLGSSRWTEDREGIVGTFYLKHLDKMMEGGLAAGELGVIEGGGKAGKSMLLGRFAAGALWQKKNVAIATGELSAKKYRKRIDAMITGIPSWRLSSYANKETQGGRGSKRARRKVRKALRRLMYAQRQMKGNLFIKQWPTNKGTIQDIENWLDQLEEEKGIKIHILFVDYLRTFKPNEGYDGQTEKLGLVAMGLRGVAGERNIPIWTASQTKRAALEKEHIGPQDLAEDISIFWTLDFLLAISQTKEEKEVGMKKDKRKRKKPEKARLYLTSARDVGSGGTIDLLIWRDTSTIRELEKN